MKREDQKRNKELEKNISLMMKECPKRYKQQKLKKKDYMLWTIRNNMIYGIMPSAGIRESDLKPVMSFFVEYKPMWIDDLLWDVIGMESNKQEPDSLRVVGAFTVGAARIYLDTIELESETTEYLEKVFYDNIETIMSQLENLTEEKYIDYLYTEKYADEYSKVLVAIHQGDRNRIKELIYTIDGNGRFINEGKSYKDWLMEYLNREQLM